MSLAVTLKNYLKLMRLHKPIGFFLLLWPTLIALWVAALGHPKPFIVFIFIAGVFVMRAAGCVINDFFDQKFDDKVSRTKNRPLVTGAVTNKEAIILFFCLMTIAFLLVLQLNIQTILLSFVAALLAILYPLMKRLINFPQAVLGAAFAWSIPMAFMAITETIPLTAWILYAATLLWVLAYDTQYAMTDLKDDLNIGIKSTAILFGKFDKIIILILQLLSLILFFYVGYSLHLRFYYMIGIVAAFVFFLYQQYLIKDRDPSLCLKAFLNNNYVGGALFFGYFLSFF